MNQNQYIHKHSTTRAFFICLLLIAGLFSTAIFGPAADAKSKSDRVSLVPQSFSSIAEMAGPAVVNIRTEKTIKGGGQVFRYFFRGPQGENDPMWDFFNKFYGNPRQREHKQQSLGSGFIIDKDGYIVTNNHVIENADKIKVIMKDGQELDAEIVGRDANTDLALLKIQPERALPVLKFGNSDRLKVGEWVVAIGNPFGLDHTVTAGVVSAKGRVIGSGPYDDFIQTDASINPGNSGGPLLNMAGEVVGINTAIIASGQGIGFAIPVNMAKGIVEQLQFKGEVTRGWLGVMIQDLSKELAEYYGAPDAKGALVAEIVQGDPADKAGIEPKDIITKVDGQQVENSRDLTRMIAAIPVGRQIEITVLRKGSARIFKVEIGKREDKKTAAGDSGKKPADELGLQVSELTPEMSRRLNLPETEGVIVSAVAPQSKAAEAGFQVGDIIKEINNLSVKSIQDFETLLEETKSGESIRVLITRMNAGFMVIQLTK
jgi:serine protease Do